MVAREGVITGQAAVGLLVLPDVELHTIGQVLVLAVQDGAVQVVIARDVGRIAPLPRGALMALVALRLSHFRTPR